MQRFHGKLSKHVEPSDVQREWNFLARRFTFPLTDMVFRGDMFSIKVHTEDKAPWAAAEVQQHFTKAVTTADWKCSVLQFEEIPPE